MRKEATLLPVEHRDTMEVLWDEMHQVSMERLRFMHTIIDGGLVIGIGDIFSKTSNFAMGKFLVR
jgi:hypothetical protein